MQILIFRLEGERFGVPLAEVHEVLAAVAVTRASGLPEAVAGLVDVRGEVTPVFDLRHRFSLPRREIRLQDHFIRAGAAGRAVLLHVDRAERVTHLEVSSLSEHDAPLLGAHDIAGVAQAPDGLVLIHDLVRFLSVAEADALDAVMRREGAANERGE